MRISELSPDLRPTTTTTTTTTDHLLSDLESSIASLESATSASSLSSETLTQTLIPNLPPLSLSLLSSSKPPFADPAKFRIWKLSYRLWNLCVDLSNSLLRSHDRDPDLDQSKPIADLRQIASNILLLAGNPAGIPNPHLKSASFFYKTCLIWHDLESYDLASSCYERATDLVSSIKIDQIRDEEERNLVLDLNLARARTALEVGDKNLAVTLLNRSKNLIFGSPAAYKALAEQFLQFGKLEISSNGKDASKLLTEGLDLCEKGILGCKDLGLTAELEALKGKCLRFLAAERLREEDFEGVLKCVTVLRGVRRGEKEHASVGFIAMKGWLGLGRVSEAEKELKGMMVNEEVPENAVVSAAELYIMAAGVEAARSVLMGLVARCRAGAGAALRVVRRVMEGSGGGRMKVVSEMVADERVVAMFKASSAAKERTVMHGILWNW